MKNAFTILLVTLSFESSAEMMLGEWLKINEPKVISYLSSLTSDDRGKKLTGVKLSDGTILLNGNTYLGNINNKKNKSFIYIFNTKKYGNIAYIWVLKGGIKIPLPPCVGTDPRNQWPGWGGAGISGEVYTYKDVNPNYGIVTTHCVPSSWLSEVAHNRALQLTQKACEAPLFWVN